MKKALRVVAAALAVAVDLASVQLTYVGLAALISERLLLGSGANWPFLLILGGPAALLAGFLALRSLYPAQFRR